MKKTPHKTDLSKQHRSFAGFERRNFPSQQKLSRSADQQGRITKNSNSSNGSISGKRAQTHHQRTRRQRIICRVNINSPGRVGRTLKGEGGLHEREEPLISSSLTQWPPVERQTLGAEQQLQGIVHAVTAITSHSRRQVGSKALVARRCIRLSAGDFERDEKFPEPEALSLALRRDETE